MARHPKPTKRKPTEPKPTTPMPTNHATTPPDLRERILADFATLKVPVRAEQFDAILARAARAGLSAHSITIEIAPAYSREQGRLAALRLLDRKTRPTAIVAANDLLALGIYDALSMRALQCPADVSVVGHNDMPYVDMLSPPLTTVRIAQRNIGNQAAHLLLDEITNPAARRERVVLEPKLIVRGSTAAPRG